MPDTLAATFTTGKGEAARKPLAFALAAATLVAGMGWAGCGDRATEPSPEPPRPTTVTVNPAAAELTALGATVQLSAEVRDQNGQVMSGATVTWSSGSAAVATVNGSGLVTAAGNGTATISATAGAVSGSATVSVAQRVDAVTVSPAADTLVAGDTLRLAAEATDANGHAVAGTEFSWASSDTTVAVVDSAGLVSAAGVGETTITATAEPARGTAEITVENPDRAALVALYHATDGPNWTRNENWLTEAPLSQWHGVGVDRDRVTVLYLSRNNLNGSLPPELGNLTGLRQLVLSSNRGLTGRIPPELGDLESLERLDVKFSDLTGSIPPELGRLSRLNFLNIWRNRVRGPIPPALGSLDNLTILALGENRLTGPIPPELGSLTRLQELYLSSNQGLTGRIPPELGNLSDLRRLWLDQNDLSGPIPPELGRLTHLRELGVANNTQMSGVLPRSLTELRALESFVTTGTGLCAPGDDDFIVWLAGVLKRRVAMCDGAEQSMAYLTQAVQSREYPVPLVAGEQALLRVFVTAAHATTTGIPPVRARFYRSGREIQVVDIPGKSAPISTGVDESSLSKSANAEIPGHVIQPGLEMVIEVDPDGTLDPSLGVAKRIPETGRLTTDVRAMPTLNLTVVPYLWTVNPDSLVVETANAMAADPEGHPMLQDTRTLLPVGDMVVTAHEPVLTNSNSGVSLGEVEALRLLEGGGGHYLAVLSGEISTSWGGWARRPGRVSWSRLEPNTVAHELGHNMSLRHAPCGVTSTLDPSFPSRRGATGAWGYDFRGGYDIGGGGSLVQPTQPDLMSYCEPEWVSDYHFTNALRYRLFDEGSPARERVAARSLLLWGGTGADSVPFLEPAFVVHAPPALPDSAGAYTVTGRTANGAELFSLSFAMPETADGDGSSSFAFVLPVQAEWENGLASVTLSGPAGSTTLDRDSNLPMAILRNPRTGQIRGILRDPLPAMEAAADGGAARAADLEVLFSRGIPAPGAWRR